MKLDKVKVKIVFILLLLIPNFILNLVYGPIEEYPFTSNNIIQTLISGNVYEKINVLISFTAGLLIISILLDWIRKDIKKGRL